jgi:hypothetical protein
MAFDNWQAGRHWRMITSRFRELRSMPESDVMNILNQFSDEELLSIRNLGPKGVAWIRTFIGPMHGPDKPVIGY